ncbi:MAG: HAD family hydrolase [Myxococcales bacterium]|nr:HAD family hydrolase [Myxococcales bacterium]
MIFLFDIDGTLLLTGGAGARALDRACEELHGFRGAMTGIRAGGKTDPLIVDEIFNARFGRNATVPECDALLARYLVQLETEVAVAPAFRILPGVVAAIDAARTRGVVGLATGNVEAGARIKLQRAALWQCFAFGGYASDDADRALLVRWAITRGLVHMARHAARPVARAEVVVIGDTPRDVAAAHANGALAIGVATGPYTPSALTAAGAEVVLETLEEFPAWLAGFTPSEPVACAAPSGTT